MKDIGTKEENVVKGGRSPWAKKKRSFIWFFKYKTGEQHMVVGTTYGIHILLTHEGVAYPNGSNSLIPNQYST